MKHSSQPQLTAISTSVRLPIETVRLVDDYCRDKEISRSQLFRRLIASYPPLKNRSAKSS